ncbi:MICAL-like protein 1 [Cyclopterus lumpus]|uniref:MICAL-like protein 1 n=1 Tax=Cyclopterus lumpus TaxID=8103 RepID=UPI00148701FB|nr:MICAL-like protein 1 [Cyclopterus lumpus]
MNRRCVAINGQCGELSEKVSDANPRVSLGAQNRGPENRPGPGPGHVPTPRERSSSTVSVPEATPRSHQRRWSSGFCRFGTSPVITVKKDKKEPQPPQRGVSLLLLPHAASRPSFKRYSCPTIGVFGSSSSSSSLSSTSSCSSPPPPVQTSVITGHDPLGWKLRPKSSSTSPRARTNRLSLQIPLPVIIPEPESSPGTESRSVLASNPDPSRENKPPLGPKPTRRRHSDSSAFLRSLRNPLTAVTLEELRGVHLRGVHLRPLALLDESDDVFVGGSKEEAGATARLRKVPPPVPEKTSMARQIAQLMTHSHQRPFTANEEILYSSVVKPKARRSPQTEEPGGLNARVTGLPVDTSCDRERSTPRVPG